MESPQESFTPDEQQHPLEVGVEAGYGADEVGSDAAERDRNEPTTDIETNGKGSNFIVNLHGLPYSATYEDITEFLKECVIVGGDNGIHFVMGDDGRRNGDAFVELASEEDLTIALGKNRKHIGKRYIDVFQIDRNEMEYVLKRSASEPMRLNGSAEDDAIVRLRGLPFGCTKEEIATFFLGLAIAPNGIVIVTDHQGRAAGDGFVRFSSPDLVPQALEKHKEKIGHRYIEVFRSSIAEMQKRAGRPPSLGGRPGPYDRPDMDRFGGGYRSRNIKGMYGGGGGFGGGYGYGGYEPSRYESSRYGGSGYGAGRYGRESFGSRDRYGGGGRDYGAGDFVSHTGHFVYMRGLPYSATEKDVCKFFSPISPTRVVIEYNRAGRPSGNAHADFMNEMDAKDAMKRHRAMMGERYIELSLNGMEYGGFRR